MKITSLQKYILTRIAGTYEYKYYTHPVVGQGFWYHGSGCSGARDKAHTALFKMGFIAWDNNILSITKKAEKLFHLKQVVAPVPKRTFSMWRTRAARVQVPLDKKMIKKK
jgi:hypothetical protein